MAGETEMWLLPIGLPVAGLVALIVGVVRGPTDNEIERWERMLSQTGG